MIRLLIGIVFIAIILATAIGCICNMSDGIE